MARRVPGPKEEKRTGGGAVVSLTVGYFRMATGPDWCVFSTGRGGLRREVAVAEGASSRAPRHTSRTVQKSGS